MDQEFQARIIERLDKVEAQILTLHQRVARLESPRPSAPLAELKSPSPAEFEMESPSPSQSDADSCLLSPDSSIPHSAFHIPHSTPPPLPASHPAVVAASTASTASSASPAASSAAPPLRFWRDEPTTEPAPRSAPVIRPTDDLASSASATPSAPAIPAEPLFDWRETLRKLSLLPPSGEDGGNLEIQVGTWWATRIGTLFVVIAAVFFGVYMAQFSKPWVRFTELAAISLGVTGLGLWLERRYPKYGAVLFGGGLAMDYFCAFAAQAVPAVRILHDPSSGALLQYAAAGAIVAAALWRGSGVIATMAIAFGYVACFFSFSAGLGESALVAALLLGGGASFFLLKRAWHAPYVLALPLTYLLYAAVLSLGWLARPATAPSFWMAHLYLVAYLALYAGTDLAALARGRALDPQLRPLQLVSSSAAAVLGYLATRLLHPAWLSEYYFLYGAILTGLAIAYYLLRHPDLVMHGYFLKGSALVTMGLVTALGGRTRWAALGVESFVLLFSARRTRLKVTELMMGAVWLVSAAFFLNQVAGARAQSSILTAVALGYVLGSALLLALHDRWLGRPQAAADGDYAAIRKVFVVLFVGALGVCALVAGLMNFGAYRPLGTALLAVAVGAVGLALGSVIPLAAAVIPFVCAHAGFWGEALFSRGRYWDGLWFNGQGLVLVTLALATGAGWVGRWRETKPQGKAGATLPAEGILHILWSLTLFVLFFKSFEPATVLFLCVAAAFAAAALSFVLPTRLLADFAPMPLALALLFCQPKASTTSFVTELALWLAMLGGWAYACATTCLGRVREQLRLLRADPIPPPGEPFQWIHGALAFILGIYTLGNAALLHGGAVADWLVVDPASMVALALAGVAAAALVRWPGFAPGYIFGLGYLAIAHGIFYLLMDGVNAGKGSFIAGALLLAALTVVMGLAPRWLRPDFSRDTRRGLQWLTAGAALLLCLVLFQRQPGELRHYTTALWGAASIAIFLAGLAGRAKPLRLAGLAGLALCIPRVFVVDIHSALYRIAASGVLGVVVLLVAFLYNHYRGVIEARDEEAA